MRGGHHPRGCACHHLFRKVLLKCGCCYARVRESYSVAGSEGSISTSVASLPPQASGGSAPSSPGSRRSVSTLKKWLTNPVRKLSSSSAGGGKGERQVRRVEGKAPAPPCKDCGERCAAPPVTDQELEWKSGPLHPESCPQEIRLCDGYLSQLVPVGSSTSSVQDHLPSNRLREEDSFAMMDDASSQSSTTTDSEEERRSALEKSTYVLKELVETEKLYVTDLGFIVEGYRATMNDKGVPEDMKGRDKIVFGNIHQIFDWHKDYFLGELGKCVEEPERLAQLFIKHERRLHMYVVYCQNKPKSEHIVSEYIDTYFEELRQQLGHRLQLNDLLIKPVQRIMKYQLLLKDFLKYYTKAGMDTAELEKAVEVMCFVPKRCNDMMNVGRLQGFEGKITAQGKLLQQDTFMVTEQDNSILSRARERRVFLFEQLVIFSEPIDRKKGFSLPGYIFKYSIKVSCLGLEACDEADTCRFVLTSRGTNGSGVRFTLQAPTPDICRAWVLDVGQILETQRNFLNALQSPIEYQRREGKSSSLGRAMQAPMVADLALRPHSSASFDRQQLPYLHAYNSSLPSLHMPSQGPLDAVARQQPTHDQHLPLASGTYSQSMAPIHIHTQHCGHCNTPQGHPAVSKGLCHPKGHTTQRASEDHVKAIASEAGCFSPGPLGVQRLGSLAKLDEDEL
uniref:Rho guanine nucleotide exchange factor 25 n=1 Tax=Paramormyrops kingsleyae TaxID=1676925 RepID=A0A3B3S385_9TELE|nr:rho guanine nucleotide exchange factor 25-like isoform X2 [Paramormyrops kingsleyae]